RWDGSAWHDVGGGVSYSQGGPTVASLAQLGSQLIVAGQFDGAGSIAAKDIAIWNGSAFVALGSIGSGVESEGSINAVTVIGIVVYMGGQFGSAGGMVSSAIARYTPDVIFRNGFD